MELHKDYYRGWADALASLETSLQNSKENNGGIFWGKTFIENAHWDYEVLDLIHELQSEGDK